MIIFTQKLYLENFQTHLSVLVKNQPVALKLAYKHLLTTQLKADRWVFQSKFIFVSTNCNFEAQLYNNFCCCFYLCVRQWNKSWLSQLTTSGFIKYNNNNNNSVVGIGFVDMLDLRQAYLAKCLGKFAMKLNKNLYFYQLFDLLFKLSYCCCCANFRFYESKKTAIYLNDSQCHCHLLSLAFSRCRVAFALVVSRWRTSRDTCLLFSKLALVCCLHYLLVICRRRRRRRHGLIFSF